MLKLVERHRSANSSSSQTSKEMKSSEELQNVSVPQIAPALAPLELQFDRLQLQDEVLFQENRLEFGQFVARAALLDEEYWVRSRMFFLLLYIMIHINW